MSKNDQEQPFRNPKKQPTFRFSSRRINQSSENFLDIENANEDSIQAGADQISISSDQSLPINRLTATRLSVQSWAPRKQSIDEESIQDKSEPGKLQAQKAIHGRLEAISELNRVLPTIDEIPIRRERSRKYMRKSRMALWRGISPALMDGRSQRYHADNMSQRLSLNLEQIASEMDYGREAEADDSPEQLRTEQSESFWTLLGALVLISSIVGGSSIGPISCFLPAENGFVKNSWRFGILTIFLAIPAAIEYIYTRKKASQNAQQGPNFSFQIIFFVLLTNLMQIIWSFGIFYGSQYVIQAHTYTLTNVHGLFIVFFNMFMGQFPNKQEYIGVALSILGCVFLMSDPQAQRSDGKEGSLTTYAILLVSSVFGAFYFMMNSKNVKSLPICQLLFLMNVSNFVMCSLLAMLMTKGEAKFFSLDPVNGCLGFLNPEVALIAFLPYGILSSFFGSAGYVLCLLFYSPAVTSNAFLLEPFVSEALGYYLGLDKLPGVLTVVGTVAIVAGVVYLQQGNNLRQDKKFEEQGRAAYSLADKTDLNVSKRERVTSA